MRNSLGDRYPQRNAHAELPVLIRATRKSLTFCAQWPKRNPLAVELGFRIVMETANAREEVHGCSFVLPPLYAFDIVNVTFSASNWDFKFEHARQFEDVRSEIEIAVVSENFLGQFIIARHLPPREISAEVEFTVKSIFIADECCEPRLVDFKILKIVGSNVVLPSEITQKVTGAEAKGQLLPAILPFVAVKELTPTLHEAETEKYSDDVTFGFQSGQK